MTCPQATTSTHNKELRSKLAAILRREKKADAVLRRLEERGATKRPEYAEAEKHWYSIVDERRATEEAILDAPIESRADVVARVRIFMRRPDHFDLPSLISRFAGQVMAARAA